MSLSSLVMVGVNHKTTPVEIREKLAFSQGEIEESLERITQIPEVVEHIIVSTCNRVEIYARVDEIELGVKRLKEFICSSHGLSLDELDSYFYTHHSNQMVEHLFKVSSSLDSMVVGEPQILGQVKVAYESARSLQATGSVLNQLFEKAFNVAKRVREETGIAENAVSISYAAVELARKIFDDLENHTVMLIGTGEMGEIAAKHLISYGVKTVYVVSRTYERATTLAKTLNGCALPFDALASEMHRADIVITSTGAPRFIIDKEMVEKVIQDRKYKPMFFIDIAVPRDIEPEVNSLENTYLYDIDDLQAVVSANLKEREKEAENALEIITNEVSKFTDLMGALDAVPTIVEIRNRAERIRIAEINKALKKMENLSEEDIINIEYLTSSIINKILHKPTVNLKKKVLSKDGRAYLHSIRQLFHLDD
jgi:glutamyl-tRNA reductase